VEVTNTGETGMVVEKKKGENLEEEKTSLGDSNEVCGRPLGKELFGGRISQFYERRERCVEEVRGGHIPGKEGNQLGLSKRVTRKKRGQRERCHNRGDYIGLVKEEGGLNIEGTHKSQNNETPKKLPNIIPKGEKRGCFAGKRGR